MSNYKLDTKLENLHVLQIYGQLEKEPITEKNAEVVLANQKKRVRELMRVAYDIPFYRERFERSGTTPEDYTCG